MVLLLVVIDLRKKVNCFRNMWVYCHKLIQLLVHLENIIFSWLSPPDPMVNYLRARELHEPHTGNWMLVKEEFLRWKDRGGIFWLHGIRKPLKNIAIR